MNRTPFSQRLSAVFLFLILFLFAGTAWCSEDQAAQNAENKTPETFITFSVKSANTFFQDIRKIGEVSSNPAFSAMIEGPIRQYLGRDFMDALDMDAPFGLALQKFQDQEFSIPLIGLPLEDPMLLLDVLMGASEDIEFTEREDGIIEFQGSYLLAANGWTWIFTEEAQAKQIVEKTPEEIFGIQENGSFQMRLYMKKMPKEFREMVRKNMEEGLTISTEPLEEESDKDLALRKAKANAAQKQQFDFFDALEQIDLTLSVHPETGAVETVCQVRLVPDSPADQKYATLQKCLGPDTLNFTNAPGTIGAVWVQSALKLKNSTPLLNNALAAGDFETFKSLSLEELQQKSWLEGAREFFGDGEKGTAVMQLFEELTDSLDETPACTTVLADTTLGNMDLVCAVQMKEPEKMKELASRIVEWAQEKNETAKKIKIEKDVKLPNGIVCDRMTLPTPEFVRLVDDLAAPEVKASESELAQTVQSFGEQFTLLVGTSEKYAFVCLGASPEETLTECLNASQTSQTLLDMRIDLLDLCRTLQTSTKMQLESLEKKAAENKADGEAAKDEMAEEEDDDESIEYDFDPTELLRKSLRQYETVLAIMEGTDSPNIRMTGHSSENVLTYQFTLESGITKLIGTLPSLMLMNAF